MNSLTIHTSFLQKINYLNERVIKAFQLSPEVVVGHSQVLDDVLVASRPSQSWHQLFNFFDVSFHLL